MQCGQKPALCIIWGYAVYSLVKRGTRDSTELNRQDSIENQFATVVYVCGVQNQISLEFWLLSLPFWLYHLIMPIQCRQITPTHVEYKMFLQDPVGRDYIAFCF